jgi:catechol 2,3-dioxygenase-like lactoylglutathione lyase family enzyme
MKLGAFSVSLAVKDLDASLAFYQALGFEKVGGDFDQNWLILRNGHAVIGLFQGMFEGNILTFNPGWNQDTTPLEDFDDVRRLQASLKAQGIALDTEADPAGTGPASFVVTDPDGNTILFDQHI